MPGPPPTPLHLKLLRGNPRKPALRPEPEPAREPTCPDPPAFIIGYAADEWWRVAPELWRLGLLRVTDVMPFCVYCLSYARWRIAVEALARVADRDEATHGLLIKSADGNARRNPLVRVAADAADDMVRVAGEFGMTPVAPCRRHWWPAADRAEQVRWASALTCRTKSPGREPGLRLR
jgi:P27 family predicted phage terminase small subunit